jgi:N-alpha-acetyltransferase 15/16, NatA auxiliary subunit
MPRATQHHEQTALPPDQRLPPKSLARFRSLFKLYEHRQYKRALRTADALLKQHPKHGETLAMRGLTLSCMDGMKTDAYESCRQAVTCYPLSFVTWHLYGLLFRGDHDFVPAIKCFKLALRCEPENIGILRDLSWMQIQVRDFRGAVATINKIIELQPTSHVNWLALAVSWHMSGEHEQASMVLQTFVDSQKQDETADSKTSEVAMYRAMIAEEAGDFEGALELLHSLEERIVDKLEMFEKRAEMLLRLKRWSEAIEAYHAIMEKYGADSYMTHKGVLSALTENLSVWELPATCSTFKEAPSAFLERLMNAGNHSKAAEFYAALRKEFPRSDAVKEVYLHILPGDSEVFAEELAAFSRAKVIKGVPSLFADLRTLFSDQSKHDAVKALFESFEASLEKDSKLATADADEVTPVAIVWVRYVLGQIADYDGDSARALAYIDQCLEHTPTIVEIRQTRGVILKNAGDVHAAVVETEAAREMDLQDRYVNVFSTKYLLAANQHKRAVEVAGGFTKPSADPEKNLDEMQALWFALHAAAAHNRAGRHGRALKKLHSVETHFEEIQREQFEFHYYCVGRKQTLRAYVNVLRFEDGLAGSESFRDAFAEVANTYILLNDSPALLEFKTPEEIAAAEEEARVEKMDAAEKKRHARQKRREDATREKQAEEERRAKELAAAAISKNTMHRLTGREAIEDTDPFGLEFLRLKESSPLDEAIKRVRKLLEFAPKWPRTHELNAEAFLRRQKPLVVLRSIRKLQQLVGSDDPVVATLTTRLFHLVRSGDDVTEGLPAMKGILDEAEKDLMGESGMALDTFILGWLEQAPARSSNLAVRRSVANALAATGHADAAKKILLAAVDEKYLARGHHNVDEVVAAHEMLLREFGSDDSETAAFAQAAGARFSYCVHFHPERAVVVAEGEAEDADGKEAEA